MSVFKPRELKSSAANSLRHSSCHPKFLILVHTGAALAISLLLMIINHLLEKQIGTTGGLSGMDLRSILSTAQSVLQVAQGILLPFWSAGLLFAAMNIYRRRDTSLQSLLEGFYRLGPILRLQLLQGVIYFFVTMGSIYLSSFLFTLTPWAAPLMQTMESVMADSALMSDPEALAAVLSGALEEVMVPMMILMGLVFLLACIPVFYRFRLAQYIVMDDGKTGALAAMAASRILMKGNLLRFLRLDLSFWWFYLLDTLVTAVCYADLLLPMLGIQLPWSSTVSFFLSFVLYLICQLALYGWKKMDVEVTYAAAYDTLRTTHQAQTQPTPKSQPWNYETE